MVKMNYDGRFQRVGVFKIRTEDIRKNPEEYMPVFANMVVLCTVQEDWLSTKYIAFSPLFDLVSVGLMAPEYDIIMNADGTVEAERIKGDEKKILTILVEKPGLIKRIVMSLSRKHRRQTNMQAFADKMQKCIDKKYVTVR